jgi:hypothetical protein
VPVVTTVLSSDPILSQPVNLTTDGTYLYVVGVNLKTSDPNRNPSSGQSIFRVPLAGGAASSLYPAYNPQQIALIGSTMYWIDPNSGVLTDTQILSAPKAGGGTVTAIYNQPNDQVIFDGSGLTTDGTYLYASDFSGGAIYRLDGDGTGLMQIAASRFTSAEQYNCLSYSPNTVYVADSGRTGAARIQSVPSTGTAVTTIFSGTPFVTPLGVAVGGGTIYVSDPGASNTIWTIPQTGGTPTSLVAGSPFKSVSGLCYYSGTLYIADTTGNAIYKIAVGSATAPPAISTQPSSASVNAGAGVSFSVTATGTGTLTYQWYLGTTAISGATASTYSIASAQASNAGSYTVVVTNSVGSVTSGAATLTVVSPPAITTQPANVSVSAGAAATFSVTATGTGTLTYQWYLGGSAIGGATLSSYTIKSSQASNAGSYTVTVSNSAGSVTSKAATLTVVTIAPLTITTQPASVTANAGSGVIFSVIASGTGPLSYQWYLNGTAIAGATESAYTIASLQSSNAGSYTVVVANAGGSVTSGAATLALSTASSSGPLLYAYDSDGRLLSATYPTDQQAVYAYDDAGSLLTVSTGTASGSSAIAAQPVSQTINAGGSVVFTVTANGSVQSSLAQTAALSPMSAASILYQWQRNGVNLTDGGAFSGSTGPQLLIQGASAANDGNYDCVVTIGGVSTTSNSASLQVEASSNPGSVTSISARAYVGTQANILIGGFYVSGSTSATVLVQAIGPALSAAPFNVGGVLAKPGLTIHQTQNGKDVVLYSDVGWGSSSVLLAAAAAAYAEPVLQPGSNDSELLLTLPPGGYTAEVSGSDGGTGVALCAIYQLP